MVDVNKAVIIPVPPRPPRSNDEVPNYRRELNRFLEFMQRYLGSPFYLRGTGLYFLPGSLSTTGYGLQAGEVFANDGVLTVVRPDDIWAGGFAITTGLGTLTVTT